MGKKRGAYKQPHEKRTRQFLVKLTEEEYELLAFASNAVKRAKSSLARELIFDSDTMREFAQELNPERVVPFQTL
jgi:hypothetical protein